MKMDQVAHYCRTERGAAFVKGWLGLTDAEWIQDTVTAVVRVNGVGGINVAELQFYNGYGIQFEILRYIKGPNWMDNSTEVRPHIAHLGWHLDEGEAWPTMKHAPLVQEVLHTTHTNPELIRLGKSYQYRIHRIADGTYWKFIKRIHST